MIGFGALERVGPDGHVIFTDVSAALLDQCDRIAEAFREAFGVLRPRWATLSSFEPISRVRELDRMDELDREGIDAPVERAEWAVESAGELRERARLARGG